VESRGHDIPREGWSYSGDVWTDGDGRAVVVLPTFVRAHRHGFDYELTPLESPCSAVVAEEIADNRFTIATDGPHMKVAWRVTAFRASENTPTPRSDPDSGGHPLEKEESQE
jgi:hypothetical protein